MEERAAIAQASLEDRRVRFLSTIDHRLRLVGSLGDAAVREIEETGLSAILADSEGRAGSLRDQMRSQSRDKQRSIESEEAQWMVAEALEVLRFKLHKFAEFLSFETAGRVRCVPRRSSSVSREAFLASEGSMAAVADVWRLWNKMWAPSRGSRVAFARLPKNLVQRTMVHGLGTLAESKVEELFTMQWSLGSKQGGSSSVLEVVSGKEQLEFPLTIYDSLQQAVQVDDRMAADGAPRFHFLVKVKVDESVGVKSLVESPELLLPVELIVYRSVPSQQK